MRKAWIYWLGILPFALSYYWWKQLLSGPAFLLAVVVFAATLRLIAERFGRDLA